MPVTIVSRSPAATTEAKSGPTDTELRAKAAALGVTLPPPRTSDLEAVRVQANQMLALLKLSDERAA